MPRQERARCDRDPVTVGLSFIGGVALGGAGGWYLAEDAAAGGADKLKLLELLIENKLGAGIAEALPTIGAMLSSFGTHFRKDHALQNPLLVNLAMAARYVACTEHRRTLVCGTPYTDKDVLLRAARFSKFAAAAYCSTAEDIAGHIPELGAESIVHVHRSESVSCPNFFIADDPATNSLVLCVRGTASVADALTDMLAEGAPFLGGQAHAGILRSSDEVVLHAKPVLQELLAAAPARKVVVVGHSMGAGIAILTTLRMFADSGALAHVVATSRVACFAFAPPPVFASPAGLPSSVDSLVYSFVNGVDCVPRACLGTIAKLFSDVRRIDELPLTPSQRLNYIVNPSTHAIDVRPHGREPGGPRLPDFLHSFRGVGTIISLNRGSDGELCCQHVSPDVLDQIILHPDMINCHLIDAYTAELMELVAGR